MSLMAQPMTAAEIVALARKGTAWCEERASSYRDGWHLFVYGLDDYEVAKASGILCGPSTAKVPLMQAPLTPKNTASEDTLVRALVASAVVIHKPGVATLGGTAWLCDTTSEATQKLLDALLAAPEVTR